MFGERRNSRCPKSIPSRQRVQTSDPAPSSHCVREDDKKHRPQRPSTRFRALHRMPRPTQRPPRKDDHVRIRHRLRKDAAASTAGRRKC